MTKTSMRNEFTQLLFNVGSNLNIAALVDDVSAMETCKMLRHHVMTIDWLDVQHKFDSVRCWSIDK